MKADGTIENDIGGTTWGSCGYVDILAHVYQVPT